MTIEQAITALNNHQRVYRAPQDYNSTPIHITRIERIANWQGQHTVCHCTQGPDLIKTTPEELHLICPAQLEYKREVHVFRDESRIPEMIMSKEQIERLQEKFHNDFVKSIIALDKANEKETDYSEVRVNQVPSIKFQTAETHNHYYALLRSLNLLTDEELKYLEKECKRIRYIRL